ncbi:hypothetical protein A2U01_0103793, partial [Trifolium medium]|nr:hypothetical protein [Trifolium medium]
VVVWYWIDRGCEIEVVVI